MDERWFERLSTATGAACVAIGTLKLVTGTRYEAGYGDVSATVDSQERFWGAIFAAYGVMWVRAAQTPPTGPVAPGPDTADIAAGAMLLGGMGRVVSMLDRARPHPFMIGLTAVEFVVPAVLLPLGRARRRLAQASGASGAAGTSGASRR